MKNTKIVIGRKVVTTVITASIVLAVFAGLSFRVAAHGREISLVFVGCNAAGDTGSVLNAADGTPADGSRVRVYLANFSNEREEPYSEPATLRPGTTDTVGALGLPGAYQVDVYHLQWRTVVEDPIKADVVVVVDQQNAGVGYTISWKHIIPSGTAGGAIYLDTQYALQKIPTPTAGTGKITWTAISDPAGNVYGYRVYESATEAGTYTVKGNVTSAPWEFTNVVADYWYKISVLYRGAASTGTPTTDGTQPNPDVWTVEGAVESLYTGLPAQYTGPIGATATATGPTGYSNVASQTLTYINSSSPAPDFVELYCTVNGGANWTLAGNDSSVDGLFDWTVPADGTYHWNARAIGGGSTEGVPNSTADIEAGPFVLDRIAPSVSSTTPANDAPAVSWNQNVVVVFNESMNTTVTPTLIQTAGVSSVTYTFSGWSTTTVADDTATWTHPNWDASDSITLNVSDAKDKAGNPMSAAYSWSFTTASGATATATGPTDIISNDPAQTITYDYSSSPAPTSVELYYTTDGGANWISIGTDSPVDGSFDWAVPADDTYYWNARAIGGGSTEGVPNSAADIEAGPFVLDRVAPEVISTVPANDATGVAVTANVVVTFNETMNTTTVTKTCSPDPGGWSVAWNGAHTVATYSHSNPFTTGTTYTFTITAGNDMAGNALTSYSWSFTTIETVIPTVTTNPATSIGTTTATLNMVYTIGTYASVEVRFDYKKTADTGWSYTSWETMPSSGSYSESLTGLTPGTEYQFKATLRYDTTIMYGVAKTFTTTMTPPTVTTNAATGVGTTTATLNMVYTIGTYASVEVRFDYKKTADTGWSYTSWETKPSSGSYSKSLTGLSSGTEYQFKATLRYDTTIMYGVAKTFTTTMTPPEVTTNAATGIGTTTATLNMAYTVGTYGSVEVRFDYKKTADTAWSYTNWETKTSSDSYSKSLTGLSSGTEYQFKATLRYDTTIIYGGVLTFTTAKVVPTVTTTTATDITDTTATLNMVYTLGDYTSVEVWFRYRWVGADSWVANTTKDSKSSGDTHSEVLTVFIPDNKYEFEAMLKYNITEIPGGILNFTTLSDTTAPAASTGLTATPGNAVVDLSWTANTESDLAGYNVYSSTTPGSGYVKINNVLITETAYTDAGLTNGVTYYYVVTAVDDATLPNESPYSNEVSATPDATGWISGMVTDKNYNSIESATVTVLGTSYYATTDADGEYTISGVPPGTYNVIVNKTGYKPATKDVTVTAALETEVDFELEKKPENGKPGFIPSIGIIGTTLALLGAALIIYRKRRK